MGKAQGKTTRAVQAGDSAIILSPWRHEVVDIKPLRKLGGKCSFNGIQHGEVDLNDKFLNQVAVVENGRFQGLKPITRDSRANLRAAAYTGQFLVPVVISNLGTISSQLHVLEPSIQDRLFTLNKHARGTSKKVQGEPGVSQPHDQAPAPVGTPASDGSTGRGTPDSDKPGNGDKGKGDKSKCKSDKSGKKSVVYASAVRNK